MNDLISIILPTYNRLYSLKEVFLPSLEKQSYLDYELIVIDDCSNDGTEEYFESESFNNEFRNISERLIFRKNKINLGLPASRNEWVSISNWNWIFMSEDDLYLPDKNFLLKSKKIIEKYKNEFSIISPQRIEESNWYFNDCFNGFIKIWFLSWEIYTNSKFKDIQKFIRTTQACSFISKEVFNQVRYRKMRWVAFREESDFYYAATRVGFSIIYVWEELITKHFNNFSKSWGTRQDWKNIFLKEFNYIKCHYLFLKRYYIFSEFKLLFFIFVRLLKHVSNVTRLSIIKKILANLSI